MKLINVLILFLICFCLKQLKPNLCIAENMYKIKTVKQIIHDNDKLMKLRNSEEEVFVLLFRKVVHDKSLSGKLVGSEDRLIAAKWPQLTEKEYSALFNEQLDQNTVDQYQYKIKHVLADSICAFYGIERKDLIDIRQNKKLAGRDDIRNNDVNNLFNTCLDKLNEKFNIQKNVQKVEENPVEAAPTESEPTLQKKQEEQNEIADLVVKKLIEKLNKEENSQLKNEIADLVVKKLEEKDNTLSIPLAPTLPTDIFF